MEEKKWWKDKSDREYVVDLLLKQNAQDNPFQVCVTAFKTGNTWVMQEHDDIDLSDAAIKYLEILSLNEMQEEIVKDASAKCEEHGVQLTLKNFNCYAQAIVRFAQSMQTIGFTSKQDLERAMPLLYFMGEQKASGNQKQFVVWATQKASEFKAEAISISTAVDENRLDALVDRVDAALDELE